MKYLRIILVIVAILVISPVVLATWFLVGKPFMYHITFGPQAAEEKLALFGYPNISIARISQHSGQPIVWMDGAEKFVAELTQTPALKSETELPAPIQKGNTPVHWETPNLWFAATTTDPDIQAGIQTARECAESDAFGTTPITLPQNGQNLLFSFRYFSNQSSTITALIYDPAAKTLTFLNCNY